MTNKPNSRAEEGIPSGGINAQPRRFGKSAFALAISAILAGTSFAANVSNEAAYNADVAAIVETTTTVTSSIAFTGPVAAAASSSAYTLQGVATLTQPVLNGASAGTPALTIATPVALIKNLHFTQFTTGAVAAGNIARLEDIRFSANVGGGAVAATNITDGILNGNFVANTNGANGGAVAVAVDLDGALNNVRFANNTSGAQGGAIYIGQDFGSNNAASTIVGSDFNHNIAATDGGAIAIGQDFDGTIDNSQFDANDAQAGSGGALYVAQDFGSKLGQLSEIKATQFTNNVAGANGAAIAVGNNFDGAVDGSTFLSNAALGDGGALYVGGDFGLKAGATSVITNSTFESNTAANGGAIAVADDFKGDIADSTFKTNTAAVNGGAISSGTALIDTFEANITNSVFESNTATAGNGGAIATSGNAVVTIDTASRFEQNTAPAGNGGAIAIGQDLDGTVGASFVQNDALAATGNGGAIFVARDFGANAASKLDGATFDTNKAGLNGGAVAVARDFKGNIENSGFNTNEAVAGNGGAVFVGQDFAGDVVLSVFDKNVATAGAGGAIYVTNDFDGKIDRSTFKENDAALTGGAIHIGSDFGANAVSSIDGATFDTNKALGSHGGAVAVVGDFTGNIINTEFSANEAQGLLSSGGALYVGGNFTGDISGSTTLVQNNKATIHGGAISITGDFDGKVADGRFLSNEAQNGVGGAIAVFGNVGANATSSIEDATFRANQSALGGGAVAVLGNFDGDVKGSTFDANHANAATADAGAIGVQGNFTGNIDNSTFTANTAGQHAGAVGVGGNFTGNITNSTFDSNVANNDGGAIAIQGNFTGDIDGVTFNKNVATTSTGGAIVFGANVTGDVKNSTFTDNTANGNVGGSGGAIAFVGNFTGSVADSTFIGNEATERGGAIATWGASTQSPNISGSTFVGNKADGTSSLAASNGRGGALALNDTFAITNSTFLANVATTGATNNGVGVDGVGGALHHRSIDPLGSTLTLDATAAGDRILFYGNTANPDNTGVIENAIHFANEAAPGNDRVVTLDVTGAGDLLLLDGISSQDGVAAGRGRVTLNVTKAATETGNFYLGGRSNLADDSTWNVDGGSFVLTTVDYGAGAVAADVALNGATAAVNLGSGATLAGSGTISAVAGGFSLDGTIDPSVWENTGTLANAITNGIPAADIAAIGVDQTDTVGKLTLNGNTTLGATAVYNVTARTDGSAADQIEVVGNTNINTAATVSLTVEPGTWTGPSTYTIVDGTAGVLSGNFDAANSSLATGYLFMDAALDYSTPNQVDLNLTRNNLAATIGTTYNQTQTGVAIDGVADTNPLVGGLMNIATVAEALSAFDNLSGELYSSTGTALLVNSSHIRNVVADRFAEIEGVEGARGLWLNVYGYTGELKGNSNTVKAEIDNSFGFAVGGDLAVGQNSNVGILFGYEVADVDLAGDRSSNADVDTFNFGAYFGSSFGGLQFRSGLAHSRHDIDSQRSINAGYITGNNTSSYDAALTQLFVDFAYPIQVNEKFSVSPYAGISQLWLSVDGARETGTVATLETYDWSVNTAISNLGLRFKSSVSDKVALHGGLGWQHAFDKEDGQSRRRFWNSTGSSADFSVKGARLGEDLLTITLGINGEIAPNQIIGLDYRGEVSSQQKQHGGQLHYSLKF